MPAAPAPTPAAPVASANRGEPVATSIERLTPAEAKVRLDELVHDKEWGAKFINAKPGSADRNLFDMLARRSADMPAVEAKSETTEAERARAGLEPPAKAEDYVLTDHGNRPIELSDEDKGIVHNEVLPVAREMHLSQLDVSMATLNVLKPSSFEQCESFLKKFWGAQYEERVENFRSAISQNPRAAALLEKYPIALGNNGALIASVVANFRRRQGKR
jgi:hypothetical protein